MKETSYSSLPAGPLDLQPRLYTSYATNLLSSSLAMERVHTSPLHFPGVRLKVLDFLEDSVSARSSFLSFKLIF